MSAGKRNDAYFDNTTFSTVYTTLKSYVLWDIYGESGFMKNKLKLFADLRNITNSEYTEISGFSTLGFNGYGGILFLFWQITLAWTAMKQKSARVVIHYLIVTLVLVKQCQCYGKELTVEQKTFLEQHFTDCLCRNCLTQVQNEFADI